MTLPPPPDRWNRMTRKIRRAVFRDEPTYYDMFENQGEKFFARLYLRQIRRVLQEDGFQEGPCPLKILDAGCQAGRLSIPMSLEGHQVTGVDTSGVGLERLKRHAKEQGAVLRVIRADLGRWLPAQPKDSFDVIICSEVLYLRRNYRALLEGLIRLLRPRGLLFVSHRPTAYYLAEAFQRGDWDAVRLLQSSKEGTLFGSYYNWQDREDLEQLYGELPIENLEITPIGFLSWLAVNPERLDQAGQDLLFQAEVDSMHRCRGAGRYLLVSGRKKQ